MFVSLESSCFLCDDLPVHGCTFGWLTDRDVCQFWWWFKVFRCYSWVLLHSLRVSQLCHLGWTPTSTTKLSPFMEFFQLWTNRCQHTLRWLRVLLQPKYSRSYVFKDLYFLRHASHQQMFLIDRKLSNGWVSFISWNNTYFHTQLH